MRVIGLGAVMGGGCVQEGWGDGHYGHGGRSGSSDDEVIWRYSNLHSVRCDEIAWEVG